MNTKILDKLQKLIALQESAHKIGSLAEAEACAEAIQKLLNSHNLSMDDVEQHAALASPIDAEPLSIPNLPIELWQAMLLTCLSQINGCYAVHDEGNHYFIVGRESDREIVRSLYKYFEGLGKEREAAFRQENAINFGYGFTVSMLITPLDIKAESYMMGFTTAICQRLSAVYLQGMEEAKDANQTMALACVDARTSDAIAWVNQQTDVNEEALPDMIIDESALERGRRAGSDVALTDKVLV